MVASIKLSDNQISTHSNVAEQFDVALNRAQFEKTTSSRRLSDAFDPALVPSPIKIKADKMQQRINNSASEKMTIDDAKNVIKLNKEATIAGVKQTARFRFIVKIVEALTTIVNRLTQVQ